MLLRNCPITVYGGSTVGTPKHAREHPAMIRTTPFHERLSELNTTGLWTHWSGYLSALKYDMSPKHEYFAVRNSAGFFDTSPLFKYWIRGTDAERFLGGVMTRDVR